MKILQRQSIFTKKTKHTSNSHIHKIHAPIPLWNLDANYSKPTHLVDGPEHAGEEVNDTPSLHSQLFSLADDARLAAESLLRKKALVIPRLLIRYGASRRRRQFGIFHQRRYENPPPPNNSVLHFLHREQSFDDMLVVLQLPEPMFPEMPPNQVHHPLACRELADDEISHGCIRLSCEEYTTTLRR